MSEQDQAVSTEEIDEISNETSVVQEIAQYRPLADNSKDMQGLRTGNKLRSLNDQVDVYHIRLMDDDKYRRFLDAVYREQAVEGNLLLDDAEAARMIRDTAAKAGDTYIADQNLATLIRALNTVLRRFNSSRSQRRDG